MSAHRPATSARPVRLSGLVVVLLGAVIALALTADGRPATADARSATATAAATAAARRSAARLRQATAVPLRFGIYPGGGVGMVGPQEQAHATRPDERLDALRRLRGDGRELVLHIYSDWSGAQSPGEEQAAALAEVDAYTAAGFQVEPVLRYRPARARRRDAVRGYIAHVRRVVRRLVANPRAVAVQIANEVNVVGAPTAADGGYPGAHRALVAGVVAAAEEADRAGRPELEVGFNWASGGNSGPDAAFWRRLQHLGGASFARAVDWVGVDIYPDTWSHVGADDPAGITDAMTSTLRYLRQVALPRAGLEARGIALRITENGFPTGATRDDAVQARQLEAAITAVEAVRRHYGVTDYRWFDLRDSRSGSADIEHGYGILRDDYTEKPGFAVLAGLVQRLGR